MLLTVPFPLFGMELSFNVNLTALLQIFPSNIRQTVEEHDTMPFRALNGVAGFLVLDGLAGGDAAGGDRIAVRHKSSLWVLPEVADEDDFVDALAHGAIFRLLDTAVE